MATTLKPPSPTMGERIGELREKREKIKQGGGKQRLQKQHEAGKLTARERVEKLVDQQSFQEIGLFAQHRATYFGMAGKDLPADGVVTGCATVDGRLIHLASQDFTVAGGAAGEVHCAKITEMMKLSMKTGSPFVSSMIPVVRASRKASTAWQAMPVCFTTTLCFQARCRRYPLSAAHVPAEQPIVRH